MDEKNIEESGLTTQEALTRLCSEIESVLKQFKQSQSSRESNNWIKEALQYSNQYTTINWITILFQIWLIISLLISIIIDCRLVTIIQCGLIVFLLVINLIIELYENRLRYNEIPNRIKSVVEKIRNNLDNIEWLPENYPNLFSPYSPCITLQWTYRDNKLVNLPWSLLVKDDIILIRPGQYSPGYCEAIDKINTEYQLLHYKQVYLPTVKNPNEEIFSTPKLRKPLKTRKYRLLETPYLNNLRIYLEQSLERPVTLLNQQRYLIMVTIVCKLLLPLIFIIIFIINLFKYFYYTQNDLIGLFLISPNLAVLPLLPLIFPIVWNLVNYIGMAKFIAIFDNTKKIDFKPNQLEEDTDTTTIDYTEIELITWRQIWDNFLKILKGNPEILFRSANILHVFGSVTALGCVDKKGVLSWPNPTAEKVFFLHNNDNLSPSSSLSNVGDLIVDNDSGDGGGGGGGDLVKHNYDKSGNISATAEVLDLTHNHNDPFKLHFDDQDWYKHLTSLKPLGLSILLNTCNIDTQENYAQFCSHITCEAAYNESLIPITNRRCLCELAKEIGFVDQAQKIFGLEQQLSTFRHLQPEMVRRDNKYARSLQMQTKLKFPFPHMFAVIVKELSSGTMQLLSEGTADIILDSCVDYWDGRDLSQLTMSDRKKIQDFYQRSSLTAYCTAFAYRPLNKIINNNNNNQIKNNWYLELPSDSRHLYTDYRSPTPVHWECSKNVLEPKIKAPIGQFYSTDSLLYTDCPSVDASDTEACFHMQCNQVFIGMVTMQYQALADMVQLIEQLERACIRFVHFSKENELRSRVFSEKMGLESGWNCHISLLSERSRRNSGQTVEIPVKINQRYNKQRRFSQSVKKLTTNTTTTTTTTYEFSDSILETSRALSFSAPSAINMEHSTVKFETDLNKTEHYTSSKLTSNESLHINNEINQSTHDWQSLSCLTDSTEHSAPINFDMSNRAKLPRGIDKIRPHIEQIDNVPLLVSLFTDCTPNATREMLNIMQDYSEIVCIMGSSANCENAGIFMQADASIAIQPLFPQVCQKIKVYQQSKNDLPLPVDLSRDLNSIACSLSILREDPVSFYHLIMQARYFVVVIWNSIQFWLLCCLLLSLLQIITNLLFVPLPFTIGQLLWLCCFVIPILSVSLLCIKIDMDIMKKPQIKSNINNINFNLILFILWCYGLKFLPTIIVSIIIYLGILSGHCQELCVINNCTCISSYLPDINGNIGWLDDSWTIFTARLIIVFIILLHFVVISIGFVYRDHLLVKKLPNTNGYWLCSVFILIVIHSIYTIVILVMSTSTTEFDEIYQFRIPLWVVLFASLSPVMILLINELVKRQEIIVKQRSQKRARLDFGTKLGMNSPF